VGWLQLWMWLPFVALVTVYLFLLFPDGRLPGPSWRPVSWLAGTHGGHHVRLCLMCDTPAVLRGLKVVEQRYRTVLRLN